MPNKTVQSYDIVLDDSEASNTITGLINGKNATMVVKSLDKMIVTIEGKTVEVKIELVGSSLLKNIKVKK